MKEPSKIDWSLSKQAIKLLKRTYKKDPYLYELACNCEKGIKSKDYKMYRENMDKIIEFNAKLHGKTLKETKKMIDSGFESFKKRFRRKKD